LLDHGQKQLAAANAEIDAKKAGQEQLTDVVVNRINQIITFLQNNSNFLLI
jgi:hypothetical protein